MARKVAATFAQIQAVIDATDPTKYDSISAFCKAVGDQVGVSFTHVYVHINKGNLTFNHKFGPVERGKHLRKTKKEHPLDEVVQVFAEYGIHVKSPTDIFTSSLYDSDYNAKIILATRELRRRLVHPNMSSEGWDEARAIANKNFAIASDDQLG